MSDTQTYLVLSPIRRDSKIVKPDGKRTVELDDDEAEELLFLNAVSGPLPKPEAKAPVQDPPPAPEDKAPAKGKAKASAETEEAE